MTWNNTGANAYSVTRGDIAPRATTEHGSCAVEGLIQASFCDATIPPVGGGSF